MKNEKNVIHLATYLNEDAKVSEFSIHKPIQKLSEPDGHLVKRGSALVFDIATIAFLKTLLHSAYLVFVSEFLSPFSYLIKKELSSPNMGLHILIFAIVFISYFFISGLLLEGGTIGKKIMGLKVVNNDFIQNPRNEDSSLLITQSLKRSIGYLACYLSFGTFFVFHFSSEDKRGLPDFLSNTRTVSDEWLIQMSEHKEFEAEVITIDIGSLDKVA